jgi:hypothetical protein
MKKKIVFIILVLFIAIGCIFLFFKTKRGGGGKPDAVKKDYATLSEYEASLDYSCQVDLDCVVKDMHNCCGYYPKCMNVDAKTDSDFVRKFCTQEKKMGVCGFTAIDSCQCSNGQCVGQLKNPFP